MQNREFIEKPLILAVETSGRTGSVAIGQGNDLSDEKFFTTPMRHSIELFDTIRKLTVKIGKTIEQIDEVYIAAGPGSFTGIRIAVTMAKMFSLANNTKIVAVDTLDAIAENANDYVDNGQIPVNRIGTILDAKRGQFFTAIFERHHNNWNKIMPDTLLRADEFLASIGKEQIWLLGEGLVYYAHKFKSDKVKILDEKYWLARASNVFAVGKRLAKANRYADPVSLVPLYLRLPEAEENLEKKNQTRIDTGFTRI